MKIRKANRKDAVKMNNLKKRTFQTINSKYYPKKLVEAYLKKQKSEKIIENMKEKNYFVLEDKGGILGMACLSKEGVLSSLYIRANQVNKGYGKKLLLFVEKYAKKKGLKEIKLYSTLNAIEFYKREGYKRTKKKDYWKLAGYKLPNHEMKKRLN